MTKTPQKLVLALSAVALMATSCQSPASDDSASPEPQDITDGGMTITSPAFEDGDTIPLDFTCDGRNVNPALAWTEVPEGAAELILIVDDPDAPGGTFTHWVMYGISPDADGIAEDAVAPGAKQGTNDLDATGYNGPCPPPGTPHNYFFSLYAVGESLDLGAGATAEQVRSAFNQTDLDRAQLIGRYGR